MADGSCRNGQEAAHDATPVALRVVWPSVHGQVLLVHRSVAAADRSPSDERMPTMKTHTRVRATVRRTLQAMALISVARRIGLRRGGRLALLAADGYLHERRRRNHRH
jgi:hypothetical protein